MSHKDLWLGGSQERSPSPGPKRGFTLIELLIVIAIIVILAAMLFPALSKAKALALRAKCLSNERQLALTWLLYSGDHNEFLVPNGEIQPGSGDDSILWVSGSAHPNTPYITNDIYLLDPKYAAFAPYLKGSGVYRCPADRGEMFVTGGRGVMDNPNAVRNRSYSLNAYLGPSPLMTANAEYIMPQYQRFLKTTDIVALSPSETFSFQDVNPASICYPAFIVRMPGNKIDGFFHYPSTQHDRYGVLAFADGHAESHRWTSPSTFRKTQNNNLLIHSEPSPGNEDLRWLQQHTTIQNR